MTDHVKDGGYRSRKMVMAYVLMVLGVAAWCATGHWPALAVTLGELYMFLIGAASLFVTGNVVVKAMAGRTPIVPPTDQDPKK